MQLELGNARVEEKQVRGVTPAILGLFLVLTLIYFAFSAPAVIDRWTEGNYTLIVLVVSLLAVGWVLLSLLRPQVFQRIDRRFLLAWNLAFSVCLTGTILAHAVPFPSKPDSASVLVGSPAWWQAIPLVLMLLFFPVLFFDMGLFLERIRQANPAPRQLVPGFMLGILALILLIFAIIFTNVWGYVQPVSLFFRGRLWLAYLLPAGTISLLAWGEKKVEPGFDKESTGNFHWAWALLLGGIFLGTLVRALPAKRLQVDTADRTSLKVMTFNIQEANDANGERSFDRQLALIRKVSPDILALQETD